MTLALMTAFGSADEQRYVTRRAASFQRAELGHPTLALFVPLATHRSSCLDSCLLFELACHPFERPIAMWSRGAERVDHPDFGRTRFGADPRRITESVRPRIWDGTFPRFIC